MKLKDLLIEKDLTADIPALKADLAKEKNGDKSGIQEGNIDVEISFNVDDEPKKFTLDIDFEYIDDHKISIESYYADELIKYGVPKQLIAKAIKTVKNINDIKGGIYIIVNDADYGIVRTPIRCLFRTIICRVLRTHSFYKGGPSMAVTITSAMPQMVSYGFDDKSGGQTVRNIQPSPDHCPIFLIQAERGPISSEVPAVYISDGGMRTSLFGTKTFDPTGSYATHQTIGSNVVMEHANSHFLTRLWPSNGGPKASIRFSLHVKHEDIPVWLRNADGSIVTTALGSKVQDGNLTVPGATLMVTADPVPANNFGKATIGNVSPLGAGAKVYPIIDKEVTWYGSYGNNQAVTMYPATTKTAEPINIEMFEATRAFPFKMSLLERDSALTTPTVISRISGERTLDFTFKPKSLYRPLGKELYLSRVYRTAWADSTPGQTPIYGPFGRIAVYQEQIDLVLADLFALEKAANPEFTDIDMFADPDTEKYVMNFMTATTVNNVAYTAILMADIVPLRRRLTSMKVTTSSPLVLAMAPCPWPSITLQLLLS
jgi:hypothetical protein